MTFKFKRGIIVSCQAEGKDPFNSPEDVAKFAIAAEMGGAIGIRSEGIEKTKIILTKVKIPVVGLVKTSFNNGMVRITGRFEDVENLLEIGCQVIAIDGTKRIREGISGHEFIKKIKQKYNCPIMADIATLEEAILSKKAGADFISTTLSGYTSDTKHLNPKEPNFELVEELILKLGNPIIAEGRIQTENHIRKLFNLGVNNIVIGTAITRPREITKKFVELIK